MAKVEVGTFKGLSFIHHYLFGDIYDFAGQVRKVNIAKRDFRFAPVMHLQTSLDYIDYLPHSTFDEIVEKYVDMNVAYLFCEGNGRTQREVIRSLLLEKKITADLSSLEDETIYTMYMQGTRESDTPLLKKLFATIIVGD